MFVLLAHVCSLFRFLHMEMAPIALRCQDMHGTKYLYKYTAQSRAYAPSRRILKMNLVKGLRLLVFRGHDVDIFNLLAGQAHDVG